MEINVVDIVLSSIIPSLIVGILLKKFEKRQKAKDDAVEKRAEQRRKEGLLSMEMQMANSKLTYACAMALKRGQANGEVEDGICAYESASAKYFTFLSEMTREHLK